MQIKLSGLLIDKYPHQSLDKISGELKKSLKAVIYQKGTHQSITVTVEADTYSILEEFTEVTLDCQVGTFVSNGKAIQYFKEIA